MSDAPAPAPAPPLACPKCDGDLPAAARACPACGLSAERFASFQAPPPAPEPAPELLASWQACEASWNSDDAHEQFLALAAALDAYAFAARAYRRVRREQPERAARAVAAVDRVRRMAEAAHLGRPVGVRDVGALEGGIEGPPFRRVAMISLLLFLVTLLGVIGLYVVRVARSMGGAPPPPSPPHHRAPARGVTNGDLPDSFS